MTFGAKTFAQKTLEVAGRELPRWKAEAASCSEADALAFKSPYRNNFTVDVRDVLAALRDYFPDRRPGGLRTYTNGEFRMALELALRAFPAPPTTPAASAQTDGAGKSGGRGMWGKE